VYDDDVAKDAGTDASVARQRIEAMWQTLRDWGYIPSDESRARGSRRLSEAKARVTPETLAESSRLLDEARAHAAEGLA
jgi:hypothetical protein